MGWSTSPIGRTTACRSSTARAARVSRFGGPTFGEKPGEFTAPHTVVTDSRGDVYVGEVAYTSRGQHENPPREIRSLQQFKRRD